MVSNKAISEYKGQRSSASICKRVGVNVSGMFSPSLVFDHLFRSAQRVHLRNKTHFSRGIIAEVSETELGCSIIGGGHNLRSAYC